MGLILDTTVLVRAERQGWNARVTIERVMDEVSSIEVGISVITALEMAHGVARADTAARRRKRQGFLDEILNVIPLYPVTLTVALRAGQLDGTLSAGGVGVALPDLLIGVTALQAEFAIATANVRHFEGIQD